MYLRCIKTYCNKSMKTFFRVALCFCFLMGLSEVSLAQSEVIKKFAANLQAGNLPELIKGFDEQIELDIDGDEQTLTKGDSEAPLKSFLENHPIQKFEYIHKGSSGSANYAIARYIYGGGSYRVMVKTEDGLIEKIEFKKE